MTKINLNAGSKVRFFTRSKKNKRKEIEVDDLDLISTGHGYVLVKILAFYSEEEKVNKSYINLIRAFVSRGVKFKIDDGELKSICDIKIKPFRRNKDINYIVIYY